MNTSDDTTTDRVQVCSMLHGQLVCVPCVIHVIVLNGLNIDDASVLVVVHIFVVAVYRRHILFVNFWYQEVLYLHPPSVTTDCRQL